MASRRLLLAAALALLVCVAAVYAQEEEDEERPSQAELDRVAEGRCLLSKRVPKEPVGKPVFCFDGQTPLSCCLPYHEFDLLDKFELFTGTGKNCQQSGRNPTPEYLPLKQLMCSVCVPDQVKTDIHSGYLFEEGGMIKYRICQSFVDKVFGTGETYDDCGLLIEADPQYEDPIFVVPSADLTADEFINTFKSSYWPYEFVIVPDDGPEPCYTGEPGFDPYVQSSKTRLVGETQTKRSDSSAGTLAPSLLLAAGAAAAVARAL